MRNLLPILFPSFFKIRCKRSINAVDFKQSEDDRSNSSQDYFLSLFATFSIAPYEGMNRRPNHSDLSSHPATRTTDSRASPESGLIVPTSCLEKKVCIDFFDVIRICNLPLRRRLQEAGEVESSVQFTT